MKARIMMLIMAVALVALPTMAQQEWQSTSAMQGSGSAYSAQVTAVGAAEVTDMATTTTDTYSPAQAPTGRRKTLIGGGEYGQSDQSPIGDAWPLVLFAALFAIVITIKKHKKVMKKNLKTWLVVAITAISANVWGTDQIFPAGTYYFDFTEVSACQIDIFNNVTYGYVYGSSTSMAEADVTFDDSNALNDNVSKTRYSSYSAKEGNLTYLVLKLEKSMSIGNNIAFFQFKLSGGGNTWLPSGWQKYTDKDLTNLGTDEDKKFYGKVSNTGVTWQTSGSLPSSTPKLTLSAGANGALGDDCTYGGGTTDVTAGTSVHLVAEPDEHYTFGGWVRADGSVASYLAEYDFTMPSTSLSLTATFYADNTDPSISGCAGCFRIAP
jgi:hypothetical protein